MAIDLSNPSRRMVAGNWKMHLDRNSAVGLARAVAEFAGSLDLSPVDIAICPAAPLLGPVADALAQGLAHDRVALGGQDCAPVAAGAHTGDAAAPMLASVGCVLCLVGHSERRSGHGESSAVVKAKAEQVLAAGMLPVICVGETLQQRDAGEAIAVVTGQISQSVPERATAANTLIAYEPVWAIGTGRVPSEDDIGRMHDAILTALSRSHGGSFRVLYGGSVNAANARSLLAVQGVAGALVGGASLKPDDFRSIVTAAANA